MKRFLLAKPSYPCRKYTTFLLAFIWTLGLVCGLCAIVVGFYDDAFRSAAARAPSFFSIMSVLLLPILCSILIAYIGQLWLIYPLAFIKAVGFAYVGWGILLSFGSAGWLVRLLLLFSDCVSVPLLLWFWNKVLTEKFEALLPSSVAAVLTAIGIGMIDYGVVSPFLVSLSR